MGDVILEVKNLKVRYETSRGALTAVDNVNFTVYKGEAFCLVGESGCGKSTLALAIPRLLPPNARIVSGEIIYKGVDLLRLSDDDLRKIRGKEITIVFQNPMTSLNPVYRVGVQVAEIPVFHEDLSWRDAIKMAIKQLGRVKIPDPEIRARDYPHVYSGGMKQRAMIAMMTISRPSLLIADEPTTALDVTIQAQILELLRDLRSEYGLALILITHNFGIVAEMCDRVAVMYAGKIVEIARVDELFENALHPYTKGLIDCVKMRTEPKARLSQIPGSPPDLINPPTGCRFHPRCLFATDRCRREEPSMVELGNNHLVACHLYSPCR
ncbi:MAG: ABC transporter ATP-binding protein [Desulfurococcaceae archaeon]